ncbi:S8 family serine peptidase [Thiohalophilus sp.]|uniref:S8 family serine peptidase n=1 Tax=Thiohalophilus sp. TaxID=3028392 RepID=UPI002ACEC3CC|nr:S8 family serine peptidase [Thiohalophilus sp.]MDZ7661831.1 S8 family serine peptidase [Thiohalophilus sp.]
MNNQHYLWIPLAFVLSFALSAAPRSPDGLPAPESRPDHVPGELLVKFRAQTDAAVQGSFMAELNARDHRTLPLDRVHLIRLPRGADAKAMASLYADDPRIEYAEPNYIYYTQAVPDDTDYSKLWGLNNTGQKISPSVYDTNNPPSTDGSDMDAETAWDELTDCSSTVVAVIDTGINYTHKDLVGNMWDDDATGYPNHGKDFVDNDDDPIPSGGATHGTHVAGTIGAVGNNDTGTTGVCWQASIMSVRALGSGGSGTLADVAAGIDFAVAQGARIINMSLGGPGSITLSNAITDAGTAGVLVVVAAGNQGNDNETTPTYPCNYANDNLICVAALDQAYDLASFSNYGAESVDVGAPGVNIQSAVAGGVITDDFSSWTLNPTGGDWGVQTAVTNLCPTVPSLVNPSTYCDGNDAYATNAADVAYKEFNLATPIIGAGVNAYTVYYLLDDDTLDFDAKRDGGNPFDGSTPIRQFSGYSGNTTSDVEAYAYDLTKSDCLTANCSIGFRLQSDDSGTDWGARVFGFHINTTLDGADTYTLLNGTSMATPHVAGLAALVWSYNPDYTYADVLGSVVNSGDAVAALDGTTTSGRAVDAFEALKYIQAPTGVSASVQ